jgi:hypothetical protein
VPAASPGIQAGEALTILREQLSSKDGRHHVRKILLAAAALTALGVAGCQGRNESQTEDGGVNTTDAAAMGSMSDTAGTGNTMPTESMGGNATGSATAGGASGSGTATGAGTGDGTTTGARTAGSTSGTAGTSSGGNSTTP